MMQTGRRKATIVVLREWRRNAILKFFFVKVQTCENRTIVTAGDGDLDEALLRYLLETFYMRGCQQHLCEPEVMT